MAIGFGPPEARVPTSIGRLTVVLTDRPETDREPASQKANYELEVLDQHGKRMHFDGDTGNLVPHLTQQQIQALLAFMAGLREQAEQQILGG